MRGRENKKIMWWINILALVLILFLLIIFYLKICDLQARLSEVEITNCYHMCLLSNLYKITDFTFEDCIKACNERFFVNGAEV